ncbi:MAG TPA: universal stress protein [Devosia sp.]|jgi:nucleotide-binding universal stress UspA family protein|nr:universal stress protein [Devosia sp.]
MYRNILVAADGSELSTRAVTHAGGLTRTVGSKLVIVNVTEQAPTFASAEIGWSVPASVYDDIRKANVDKSRAILKAAVRASGVSAEMLHIEEQRPFQGILEAAERTGADLIVMGSHGHRGLERLILGSQASKVLSLSAVPVLIIKS